jgi:hypothetical protein
MTKLTKIADLICRSQAGNPHDTCYEVFKILYTQMGYDLRHVELNQHDCREFN